MPQVTQQEKGRARIQIPKVVCFPRLVCLCLLRRCLWGADLGIPTSVSWGLPKQTIGSNCKKCLPPPQGLCCGTPCEPGAVTPTWAGAVPGLPSSGRQAALVRGGNAQPKHTLANHGFQQPALQEITLGFSGFQIPMGMQRQGCERGVSSERGVNGDRKTEPQWQPPLLTGDLPV